MFGSLERNLAQQTKVDRQYPYCHFSEVNW